MIEEIELSKGIRVFEKHECEAMDKDILENYPYPLAISYQNVLQCDTPVMHLANIVKDLLSTVYQYLALVTLHTYAHSGIPRDNDAFRAIESMILKPGPGKWLGFLREYRRVCSASPSEAEDNPIIGFLDRHYSSKGTRIALIDEHHRIRAQTLEALVTFRNRFAHSKFIDDAHAKRLNTPLFSILRNLFTDLAFVKEQSFYLKTSSGDIHSLMGCEALQNLEIGLSEASVFLQDTETPLRFLLPREKKKKPEVYLLDEIAKRKVAHFSSSFGCQNLSLKDQQEALHLKALLDLLEQTRPEDDYIGISQSGYSVFSRRCRSQSKRAYADYVGMSKYDPLTYVPQQDVLDKLEDFRQSPHALFLLDGASGSGKSALLAHWVHQLLENKTDVEADAGKHAVYFVETHQFLTSDTRGGPATILKDGLKKTLYLNMESDMEGFIQKALSDMPEDSQMIFVFDALNEFETYKLKQHFTRMDLLRELIQLGMNFAEWDREKHRLKLVVGLRTDALEEDGGDFHSFFEQPMIQENLEIFYPCENEALPIHTIATLPSAEAIFDKLQKSGHDMCPRFSFQSIPSELLSTLSTPLRIRFFARLFHDKPIQAVKIKDYYDLEEQVVEDLLLPKKKDTKALKVLKAERFKIVKEMLDEMKRQCSQFLRIEPESKIQQIIWEQRDKTRTNCERPDVFTELETGGIIREDEVQEHGGPHGNTLGKRLSFAHDIIVSALQTHSRKIRNAESIKFSYRMILFISIIALVMLTYLIFERVPTKLLLSGVSLSGIVLCLPIIFITQSFISSWFERFLGRKLDKHYGRDSLLFAFEAYRAEEQGMRGYKRMQICSWLFLGTFISLASYEGFTYLNPPSTLAFKFIISGAISLVVIASFLFLPRYLSAALSGNHKLLHAYAFGKYAWESVFETVVMTVFLAGAIGLIHAYLYLLSHTSVIDFFEHFSSREIWIFTGLTCAYFLFILIFLPMTIGIALYAYRAQKRKKRQWPPADSEAWYARVINKITVIASILSVSVCTATWFFIPNWSFPLGETSLSWKEFRSVSRDINGKAHKPSGAKAEVNTATLILAPSAPVKGVATIPTKRITELDALSKLTQLEYLLLHQTSVENLEPIQDLRHLKEIVLHSNHQLNDYHALRKLSELQSLTLFDQAVSHLDFIRGLEKLRTLEITETPEIKGMHIFTTLPNLRSLHLSAESFSGEKLPPLPKLEYLSLSLQEPENNETPPPFKSADFPSLKRLTLEGFGKLNFTSLPQLKALKNLSISTPQPIMFPEDIRTQLEKNGCEISIRVTE